MLEILLVYYFQGETILMFKIRGTYKTECLITHRKYPGTTETPEGATAEENISGK